MQALPLREVIAIIRCCDSEDAVLFNKRYAELMTHTHNTVEQRKFALLRSRAKRRLQELNGHQ